MEKNAEMPIKIKKGRNVYCSTVWLWTTVYINDVLIIKRYRYWNKRIINLKIHELELVMDRDQENKWWRQNYGEHSKL